MLQPHWYKIKNKPLYFICYNNFEKIISCSNIQYKFFLKSFRVGIYSLCAWVLYICFTFGALTLKMKGNNLSGVAELFAIQFEACS